MAQLAVQDVQRGLLKHGLWSPAADANQRLCVAADPVARPRPGTALARRGRAQVTLGRALCHPVEAARRFTHSNIDRRKDGRVAHKPG